MEMQLKEKPMQARNEIDEPEANLPNEETQSFNDDSFEMERSRTYGSYFRSIIKEWTNLWHFKCQFCLEEFDSNESTSYTNCKHNHYCHSCLFKYVKFKMLFFEEIECPREGCNAKLDTNSKFFQTLPMTLQVKYPKMKQNQQKLKDSNFHTCPKDKCLGKLAFLNDSFKCNTCNELFCLNCHNHRHNGSCYQQEIAFFQNMYSFRRCPNCRFFIQKKEGQEQMICWCKFQFCYRCGGPYDVDHNCRIGDNNNNVLIRSKAIKKALLEEEGQSSEMDLLKDKPKPKKIEILLYYLVMFLVITPFYIIFTVGFVLWLAIETVKGLIKISLLSVIFVFLGLGPFAIEFGLSCKYGKYLLFSVGLPLTMLIGIIKSFKELFCTVTICLYRRYKKEVKKTWRTTFTEPLTT